MCTHAAEGRREGFAFRGRKQQRGVDPRRVGGCEKTSLSHSSSRVMGSSASREAAAAESDAAYKPPSERRRLRRLPATAAYVVDSDAAAFDPTADKYDYLIVFSHEKPKRRSALDLEGGVEEKEETMTWNDLENIWLQAIPGEEDSKLKGVESLRDAWMSKFGEEATKTEVESLIRDHIIEVLSRRSGLQLKLSLSASKTKQFCQVRAPISLLEKKAEQIDYKLKFRPEVDPGVDFWRRRPPLDENSANEQGKRPKYVELDEEAIVYSKDEANEILGELYRAGKIGPHDMSIFEEEEPTTKHWSRRVHTLERIADRVPVTNEFPAYASYDANSRERHLYDEYQSVRGKTFFLAKDRLYLTRRIIDEVFDFGVLVEKELVQTVTALHDANYGEVPTSDWFSKRWVLFWQGESDRVGAPYITHPAISKHRPCPFLLRPWAQPLMEVRSYFGEKIALYFAWLGFYGYYLIYPACVGFGCLLYDMFAGVSDEAEGIHPEQFLMAVFLVSWSAYYKEKWDVESQFCAVKWGTVNFEEEEVDRPQFVGDPDQPRRLSPVTNQMETYYPPIKRTRTQRKNWVTIFFFIVVLNTIIVVIFELEYLVTIQRGFVSNLSSLVGVVQAVLIQVMSMLYGAEALRMNKEENYRTHTEYENQLVLKKFLFEIFNNYSALAITAYFKGVYFQCSAGVSKQNCLGDLKSLLESIFATRFALALASAFNEQIQRAKDFILPPKQPDVDDDDDDGVRNSSGMESPSGGARKKAREETSDDLPGEAERFESELELEEYEGTFDDYSEIVLQMGLVSMFTLGWYVVPFLGILEVLLQIRVDAYKLTAQTRRPDPMPAESVGSWGLLMESMGLLAVYANAGIIVFTTRSFDRYHLVQRLLIFFALEQILLIIKLFTHALIDQMPRDLSDIKRRNDHVVARHKIAIFDDDDDMGAGPDSEIPADMQTAVKDEIAASRGAVDADLLNISAIRSQNLSKLSQKRLEYLRRKLLAVDKDLLLLRNQYKVACRNEVFRDDLGVSYSRKDPDLALGLLTVTLVQATGVGSLSDPVEDARSIRCIAFLKDDDEASDASTVGPSPQVSKPARRPRHSNEGDYYGDKLVFDHVFSLAPVKKAKATLRLDLMEDQRRRATANLPLSKLLDQFPHKDLKLPLSFPGREEDEAIQGGVAVVHAHFQYSKIVPIKSKILDHVTMQKKLHRDVTRLQLGMPVENDWDFPDLRNLEDDGDQDDEAKDEESNRDVSSP